MTIEIKKDHALTNEEVKSILNMSFGTCTGFSSEGKMDVFEMSEYRQWYDGLRVLMNMLNVESIKVDGEKITLSNLTF